MMTTNTYIFPSNSRLTTLRVVKHSCIFAFSHSDSRLTTIWTRNISGLTTSKNNNT